MNKVIKESVDRIEEKLGFIYEGYLSDLENVFDVRIDEGCSIKKSMNDKEVEEEDEDEEVDSKDTKSDKDKKDDTDEKVEENVIKYKKGKNVTFSENDPKDEEVSEFSENGNKTDGKSGFVNVKPSSETPDKKVKKKVSENYSSFDEKKDKKKGSLVTIFTKDKKGTDSKTAGFDEENPSAKTYDSEVEREGEGELDKEGTYKGSDMGFKEKEKVGQASTEKKKKFPSKSPSQLGTPGSVKD